MQPLYFLVVGGGAGILSGMFGIGGGVVMVLAMVSLQKLPFTTATGTSLAAMLLPVGALGAWEYWRRGHVHVQGALLLALGLFLGAWVGARIATHSPPATVQRLFAVFLLAMAVRLWVSAR